jgi:heme-degrading monooxygenase HmoA
LNPDSFFQILKYYCQVKIIEMYDSVTLGEQFEADVGAVILMNKFNVGRDEVEEFIKVFADTTKVFKQQPGFLSAQLHRGIAGICTFISHVGWESVAHFRQAFDKPEFRENMVKVLPITVSTSYHCDVFLT